MNRICADRRAPGAALSARIAKWAIILLGLLLVCAPFCESAPATRELSWEMPGKLAIYDLEFGPALERENKWQFLGNMRTFNTEQFGGRLTLMVRFAYAASRPETPLRFVIKLPQARQYEETVHLRDRRGEYSYKFTVHTPEDFLGSGSVYVYYGFSMVEAFQFTIVQGM